ncbi:hypothetical protein ACIPZ5_17705 [Pseudomonas sp. NPDC089428]|uniref:hypothetical protein n=1 Tax=Pseudomonas sp. NPDC089428 TaxID=3364467 RepID=UPI0037F6BCBA
MAIQSKKINVEGKTYKITQHPATEGCSLLEKYGNAIVAFSVSQETIVAHNKHLIPFTVAIDGRVLGLLQFIDKIAAPDTTYEMFEQPKTQQAKLTVREVLAGAKLEDREEPERVPTPLSYPITYKASNKQLAEVDIESVFNEFLRYITLDGEQVDYDTVSHAELSQLLAHVIEFNFLNIWTKKRWQLPENYSSGVGVPRSLERVNEQYSQPNVIYNILKCAQPLATLTDLSLHLSVSDAYDANETALRIYYEQVEMQREAERQAKNNGGH